MQLLNSFFKIVGLTDDTCTVQFNPDHVIYQAHFPGNPVTPGVCIIQTVTEALQQRLGVKLSLSEVKNIKFVMPVSPIDDSCVVIRWARVEQETGECRARGSITDVGGEKVYTKFSLRYRVHE